MQEAMIWIWLGVFVSFIVFEAVTFEFIGIWFSVASIASIILSLFNVLWYVQLIVFYCCNAYFTSDNKTHCC